MKRDIELSDVKIEDQFWSNYVRLVREEMLPYQWKVLNDEAGIKIEKERDDSRIPSEKSHAIENFKIAAGLEKGHHYGYVFQDSDVYKWLEAVSYSLECSSDKELEDIADKVIDLIAMAQEDDGYLDTYFTIDAPERKFKRLIESHELYCAGHLFEAAAAYYKATKKEKVINIACKLADCIADNFGEEEGKIHGYDGHEEVEIGLAKLYSVTNDEKYLALSRYFLKQRGQDSNFLKNQLYEDENKNGILSGMSSLPAEYFQVHKPILEQDTAEGHAVRFGYMCTALSEAAYLTRDEEMLNACRRLWNNVTKKRMYITGGVGSTVRGEAFTFDYDLPNDTMYCETCASIAMIFFAHNMLRNEPLGEYGDVLERCLYNSAISGMALDGKHFFYVNPLEVNPEASMKDPGKSHVKATRPAWFGCACCPPNLARTITSLGKYVYTVKDNTIYTHLYLSNEADIDVDDVNVNLKQDTNYPWNGNIKVTVSPKEKNSFALAFRIPSYCDSYAIKVNGETVESSKVNGYVHIERQWQAGDEVEINLDMKIHEVTSNPYVKADLGKVAIQRGPFVYCLEEADNGKNLNLLKLPKDAQYEYRYYGDLNGGVGKIITKAKRLIVDDMWQDNLYSFDTKEPSYEDCKLTFMPYYSWANRTVGEMCVWVNKEL